MQNEQNLCQISLKHLTKLNGKFGSIFKLNLTVSIKFHSVSFHSFMKFFTLHEFHSYLHWSNGRESTVNRVLDGSIYPG